VTDEKGQTSEDTVPITIKERTEQRLSPVAAAAIASGGTSSGNPGATFNFTSAGTVSPYGTPLTYSWNFGDPQGGSSNTSAAENPSHTFFGAGNYVVTMTVTDEFGLTSSVDIPITINPIVIPLPVANFPAPSPAPGSFHVLSTINFNGTSSRAHPNVPVSSYAWNFGDGATASGGTATHAYSSPGTYVVKLTVQDSSGQSSFTTQDVVVKALNPPGNFRATGSRAKIPFFRTGYMDFAWTPVSSAPGEDLVLEIEIQASPGFSPCWDTAIRTDTSNVGTVLSKGSYRWEEPNTALLNLGKTFCAGSTYPYRARIRNKNAPVVSGVNPGTWSPNQERRV
jgi:PKD repeat protein